MDSEAVETPGTPNHLRAWREAAGLTQAQVEKILGWQHARVSHLERGTAPITQQVLQSLAPLYGCEPFELLRPVQEGRRAALAIGVLHETEQNLQKLLVEFRAIEARLLPRLQDFETQITDLNKAARKASACAAEAGAILTEAASLLGGGAKPKRRGRIARGQQPAIQPDKLV